MTWGEWVNSEYNDDGSSGGYAVFDVNRNMIHHIEEALYVCLPSDNYSFPSPATLIVANAAYDLTKD